MYIESKTYMLNKPEYINWFNDAANEHCYITNIFLYNLQNEIVATPCLSDGATTFTNWYGVEYKFGVKVNGLKNYSFISDKELIHLLNSKCFFGRKFNKECILTNKIYIEFIKNNQVTHQVTNRVTTQVTNEKSIIYLCFFFLIVFLLYKLKKNNIEV